MGFLQSGGFATLLGDLQQSSAEHLPDALTEAVPDPTEVTSILSQGLQTVAIDLLQTLTNRLPSIVASAGGMGINAFVFLLAVGTFYARGPDLLRVVLDIVPIEEDYVDALFEVFGDLANRAVGGAFATALVQGLVATLGYAIAGVEGLVFFGSLTALFAFVPLVGGAVVCLGPRGRLNRAARPPPGRRSTTTGRPLSPIPGV
ncbi:MAG: putative PurR-regulated permease PerM [Myxococcota bacterium]